MIVMVLPHEVFIDQYTCSSCSTTVEIHLVWSLSWNSEIMYMCVLLYRDFQAGLRKVSVYLMWVCSSQQDGQSKEQGGYHLPPFFVFQSIVNLKIKKKRSISSSRYFPLCACVCELLESCHPSYCNLHNHLNHIIQYDQSPF